MKEAPLEPFDSVEQVQESIIATGKPLKADGEWGPKSQAALDEFNEEKGFVKESEKHVATPDSLRQLHVEAYKGTAAGMLSNPQTGQGTKLFCDPLLQDCPPGFACFPDPKGSNAFVCYDRSAGTAFAVQCTNTGNLARLVQNRQFAAQAMGDRGRVGELVAAAVANGTRVEPEFGSVWMSMNGEDQASAGTHTTFAVPNATTASLGLPENGRGGGIWIMASGTSEAHLMIPQG